MSEVNIKTLNYCPKGCGRILKVYLFLDLPSQVDRRRMHFFTIFELRIYFSDNAIGIINILEEMDK